MPHLFPTHRTRLAALVIPVLLLTAGCGLTKRAQMADDTQPETVQDVVLAEPETEDSLAEVTPDQIADLSAREGEPDSSPPMFPAIPAAWPREPSDGRPLVPPVVTETMALTTSGSENEVTSSRAQSPVPSQASGMVPVTASTDDVRQQSQPPVAHVAALPVTRKVEKVSAKSFQQIVLNSEEPVIVDFYADWCVPCQALSPLLDQVAREKPDVRIVKVNFDEERRLARKYGVSSLPTVLVFKEGNQVAQYVGLPNIRRALAN